MDTFELRAVAVSTVMLDGFTAQRWARLEDERGTRLLVSDDERSVVVAVHNAASGLDAEAEKLASALLRSVLPSDCGFTVPQVLTSRTFSAGQLADDELYVAISEPLDGAPMSTEDFHAAPELVDSLARVVSAVHSAETGPIADAGLVVHEPQEVRSNLWELLDRGAATGRVPSALLQRWETVLETPALWHFLSAPIHGDLSIDAVRTDGHKIVSLCDVGSLRVGDPAVDLEAISHLLEPEEFDRFVTMYTNQVQMDDSGLRQRIDLRSEMAVLELLLSAVDSGDETEITDVEDMLKDLAQLIAEEPQSSPAEGQVESNDTAPVPFDSGLRPESYGTSDDDEGQATDVISR